jgi:Zn-finger nucleic acid-binding protein
VASTGPFRADPQWRCCPRCDEVLEETFPGGSACPRCGGVWLSQPVIDAAFTDPEWPGGVAMWWRRELACPECGSLGRKSVMDAIETHGVILDRCRGHGVWFDAGELQRVTDTTGDPLGVLRERVALTRPQVEAARQAYEARREAERLSRAAQREEAERAAELAALEERAAREARELREELERQRYPLPGLDKPNDLQRRELVEAITSKKVDVDAAREALAEREAALDALIAKQRAALVPVRQGLARREAELALLRERLEQLGPE